jgi:glycosyltransferase involved in cell wall biosynthesis
MIKTTFIIPSVGRDTLQRAVQSVEATGAAYLVGTDIAHKGPSVIRNMLIKQAETPWVSFLDDDDSITPDYVERLTEELRMSPGADVVIFREYFLNQTLIPAKGNHNIEWGNVGISFSVKREVALKHPFRRIRYEDYEFLKKLQDEGYTISFSPYMTYKERH